MKIIIAILLSLSAILFLPSQNAYSQSFQLPNYAQGGQDVKQSVTTKGKNLTDLATLIAGIIGILALVIAAIALGAHRPDWAKGFFFGGIGCLILASIVYGVAAYVIK